MILSSTFITDLPHPPRISVTAVPVLGEAAFTVNWSAPKVPEHKQPITGYRIRYYIRENRSDLYKNVSHPPANLTGLRFNTEYQVHVAARNADGLGLECCGGTPLYVNTSVSKLSTCSCYLNSHSS